MLTISQRLDDVNQRPSGFDFLRIFLSFAVVLWHSYPISYGLDARFLLPPAMKSVTGPILPMFFALSGFLVAGSLLRCKTLISFLGLRVIRIFPALTVEVLLSALLIGPLMTSLPVMEYFSNHLFYRYFYNIVGHIQFVLPGLYLDNPIPHVVNGQLWTVPYELICYVSLAIFVLFLGSKRKYAFIGLVALLLLWDASDVIRGIVTADPEPATNAFRFAVSGRLLVASFAAGVTLYIFREELPFSNLAGWACLLLGAACFQIPGYNWIAILLLSYATIWLGLTNFRKPFFLRYADYSYGIFLYGFVVQQAVAHLLPEWREWYWNFPITLLALIPLSAFSWHLIEKPCQSWRTTVFAFEAWCFTKWARLRGRIA